MKFPDKYCTQQTKETDIFQHFLFSASLVSVSLIFPIVLVGKKDEMATYCGE